MRHHREFVDVELGKNGLPIRIFLSHKLATRSGAEIGEMRHEAAVRLIREQVFRRAAGHCEGCGDAITEESGEMHERNPRGMTAHVRGEYSLENSMAACRKCHRLAHANRAPQWTKRR